MLSDTRAIIMIIIYIFIINNKVIFIFIIISETRNGKDHLRIEERTDTSSKADLNKKQSTITESYIIRLLSHVAFKMAAYYLCINISKSTGILLFNPQPWDYLFDGSTHNKIFLQQVNKF